MISISESPDSETSAALWLGFAAMCVGMFMAVLDIQVVASLRSPPSAALHIAPGRLGWIQTGYLMAEVIAIPSDRHSHPRAVAALACSWPPRWASPSPAWAAPCPPDSMPDRRCGWCRDFSAAC